MAAGAVAPIVSWTGSNRRGSMEQSMDGTLAGRTGRPVLLAWGAVAGMVVFNLGWLVAGALQSGGYSVARHDISDLGALTA